MGTCIAVFPILADVVKVKKGSGSAAHWSIGFIRLSGWLRRCFTLLITPLGRRDRPKLGRQQSFLVGIRANTPSVRAGARFQRAFTSDLGGKRAGGGSSNEVHCGRASLAAAGEVVITAFDVLQQYIEGQMQYIEGRSSNGVTSSRFE